MKQEEKQPGDEIGWHVIARGGDMTARVHRGMCLGQGASEELSFEPVDGMVSLSLEAGQLKLMAVRPDQELLVPGEHPARAVLVSPQTDVSLTFAGHTLDISNDFALARPAGETLQVEVIDAGSVPTRRALGPVSAPRRGADPKTDSDRTILVSEATAQVPLRTSPADHLQRPEPRAMPLDARNPLLLGGVLIGSVALLLSLAVLLPSRVEPERSTAASPADEPVPTVDVAAADAGPGGSVSEPLMSIVPAASSERTRASSTAAVMLPSEPSGVVEGSEAVAGDAGNASGPPAAAVVDPPAGARVSDALLERFDVLINADTLPDRDTTDFMVETLKSLQSAYPDDPRVPEALAALALRLLDAASVTPPAPVLEPVIQTQAPATVAAPEPAIAARASDDEPDEGLDALIRQSIGVPLGAQAVSPSTADTGPLPDLELTEASPDAVNARTLSEGQNLAETPAPATDGLVGADDLPVGFPLEDALQQEGEPPPPPYRPFDELTVTRQEPLAYPSGVPGRKSGSVEVSFTVSETGRVRDLTAEGEMDQVFIDAARRTIARWRFAPVLVDGSPTSVRTTIRVTFRN